MKQIIGTSTIQFKSNTIKISSTELKFIQAINLDLSSRSHGAKWTAVAFTSTNCIQKRINEWRCPANWTFLYEFTTWIYMCCSTFRFFYRKTLTMTTKFYFELSFKHSTISPSSFSALDCCSMLSSTTLQWWRNILCVERWQEMSFVLSITMPTQTEDKNMICNESINTIKFNVTLLFVIIC